MARQSWLLVVDYSVVISYYQQCHIGTKLNYFYAVISYLNRTLNNFNKLRSLLPYVIKNKQIDHISISKRHDVFTENFTIFFQMQRSSHRKFLRNFAKFTGKHICQNLFFNKYAG